MKQFTFGVRNEHGTRPHLKRKREREKERKREREKERKRKVQTLSIHCQDIVDTVAELTKHLHVNHIATKLANSNP